MNIENVKDEIRRSGNIGLFYGKTGASIVAFMLQNQNVGLNKQFAEELLTDVFNKINDNMPLNISQGISGIGLGINFLIQNGYVEGNADYVLKEIDEILFKRIVYYGKNDKIDCIGLCEILFYILVRLKTGLKNKMERIVFSEFAKKIFNLIYFGKGLDFYEEPLPYNVHYPMPFFLYLCSYMYGMGIYKNRINHILEEMKPMVCSRTPFLHCNRLTLMTSILHVANSTEDSDWFEYLNLLHNGFSFEKILKEEKGCKQVFFTDGLLAIYLVAQDYIKNCNLEKYNLTIPDALYAHLSQALQFMDFEQLKKNGRIGLDGVLGVLLFGNLRKTT